jgi:hypothetical protein
MNKSYKLTSAMIILLKNPLKQFTFFYFANIIKRMLFFHDFEVDIKAIKYE